MAFGIDYDLVISMPILGKHNTYTMTSASRAPFDMYRYTYV